MESGLTVVSLKRIASLQSRELTSSTCIGFIKLLKY